MKQKGYSKFTVKKIKYNAELLFLATCKLTFMFFIACIFVLGLVVFLYYINSGQTLPQLP